MLAVVWIVFKPVKKNYTTIISSQKQPNMKNITITYFYCILLTIFSTIGITVLAWPFVIFLKQMCQSPIFNNPKLDSK